MFKKYSLIIKQISTVFVIVIFYLMAVGSEAMLDSLPEISDEDALRTARSNCSYGNQASCSYAKSIEQRIQNKQRYAEQQRINTYCFDNPTRCTKVNGQWRKLVYVAPRRSSSSNSSSSRSSGNAENWHNISCHGDRLYSSGGFKNYVVAYSGPFYSTERNEHSLKLSFSKHLSANYKNVYITKKCYHIDYRTKQDAIDAYNDSLSGHRKANSPEALKTYYANHHY